MVQNRWPCTMYYTRIVLLYRIGIDARHSENIAAFSGVYARKQVATVQRDAF